MIVRKKSTGQQRIDGCAGRKGPAAASTANIAG
jgi:hypothetical protein